MLKKSWNIKKPDEFLVDKDSYIIEGVKYFRVTRIKSVINQPGLNAWRASVGNTKAKKIMITRAEFGSNFHKLSEIILMGKKVKASNYDNEMQESLGLFKVVIDDHKAKVEAVEQKLWDKELLIAGTADFIGFMDLPILGKNAHIVADWKTSTRIYEDYWIQLAAYVKTFEIMTGIKLDGAVILQIRDGKVKLEEKTYDDLMRYYTIFKCCLCLFNYTKGVF